LINIEILLYQHRNGSEPKKMIDMGACAYIE